MKKNKDIFFVNGPVSVTAVTDCLTGINTSKQIQMSGTWGRPTTGCRLDWIKIQPVAILYQPEEPMNLCYGVVIESTGRNLPKGRPILVTLNYFYGDTLALSAKIKFPPAQYS